MQQQAAHCGCDKFQSWMSCWITDTITFIMHFFCIGVYLCVLLTEQQHNLNCYSRVFSSVTARDHIRGIVTSAISSRANKCCTVTCGCPHLFRSPGWQRWAGLLKDISKVTSLCTFAMLHVSALHSIIHICSSAANANILVTLGNGCTCPSWRTWWTWWTARHVFLLPDLVAQQPSMWQCLMYSQHTDTYLHTPVVNEVQQQQHSFQTAFRLLQLSVY